MATQTSFVTRVTGLLAVAAVIGAGGLLSACTPKPMGPEPTAQAFFAALAKGDTGSGGRPQRPARRRAGRTQRSLGGPAGDRRWTRTVLSSKYAEDTGSIDLPLHLAPAQEPQLDLRRSTQHGPRRGQVGSPLERNGIAPQSRREPDPRAAGRPATPRVGERARRHRRAGARATSTTTRSTPRPLRTNSCRPRGPSPTRCGRSTTPWTRSDSPSRPARRRRALDLITLRQADHERVAPALANLPGVVITPQAELLPTDERFAPAIINEVKKSVVDELDGAGGLARRQRQPERRRRRRAQRGTRGARAVGDHQPRPRGAGRGTGRGQHGR